MYKCKIGANMELSATNDEKYAYEFPHGSETKKLCTAFTNSTSYLAGSSMSVRIQYIIKSFADRISTIVHSGVVQDVVRVKDIRCVIYAFPGAKSVKLTLDALKGRFVPTGKLPFNID